jgi:hypothetical protein
MFDFLVSLGKIANAEQSACEQCPAGTRPSADFDLCVCEEGYYNIRQLPAINCFDTDFRDLPAAAASETGCGQCPKSPSCMNCTSDRTALNAGYRFLEPSAPALQPRQAFKCPIASACPAQLLAARATLAFAATLDADLDSVDRDRAAFERAFRADVALLLRVQTASVFIAGVTGGSVVVSCEVAGVVDTGASQLKGQVVANYTVAAVSTTGTDTARLISDDCAEGHTGNLIYILSNRRGWKF